MRKILLLLLASLLFFSHCTKRSGCTDKTATNFNPSAERDDGTCVFSSDKTYQIESYEENGLTYQAITGLINDDLLLTADVRWMISGRVEVMAGYSLTIEPGTTISAFCIGGHYGNTHLVIKKDAQLIAEGTHNAPIVFTSACANPIPGNWAGIFISGNAPTNYGNSTLYTSGEEIGGDDPHDNSGILKYVRIEFAGGDVALDVSNDALALIGVGDQTRVEYIQVYKSYGDGIDLFGGTVNVRYYVATGCGDDAVDWYNGWRGFGQFWNIRQEPGRGDRGIEAENNGNYHLSAPFSNPILSNITVIGASDSDGQNTGIRFRAGTKGKVYNALVTQFERSGIRVSDSVTINHMHQGQLSVMHSQSFLNGENWEDAIIFENDSTNSEVPFTLSSLGTGVINSGGFRIHAVNAWFENATYIGATPHSANWMLGWTR